MRHAEYVAKMAYASSMRAHGEFVDYWDGYMRGLKRRYKGGEKEGGSVTRHQKHLEAVYSLDRKTAERGRGYRDALTEIMARQVACQRCRRFWHPRVTNERPHICPYCKSPYWDRPKSR